VGNSVFQRLSSAAFAFCSPLNCRFLEFCENSLLQIFKKHAMIGQIGETMLRAAIPDELCQQAVFGLLHRQGELKDRIYRLGALDCPEWESSSVCFSDVRYYYMIVAFLFDEGMTPRSLEVEVFG
jgi:hypothetical protein